MSAFGNFVTSILAPYVAKRNEQAIRNIQKKVRKFNEEQQKNKNNEQE